MVWVFSIKVRLLDGRRRGRSCRGGAILSMDGIGGGGSGGGGAHGGGCGG